MIKGTKLKCFAGPFKEIPFKYYIKSPTGLVPKHKRGQTRLVFHLLFPEYASVNHHTQKEKCTVKYKDLQHTVKLCLKVGKGCYLT